MDPNHVIPVEKQEYREQISKNTAFPRSTRALLSLETTAKCIKKLPLVGFEFTLGGVSPELNEKELKKFTVVDSIAINRMN